ncbi:MAG: calcium/sodium antiporter, partial [Gammaproteobacteria bacterium]|nr:calcium/sodium antiporter [Gammaproteobacteria bacterium]
MLSFFGIVAGLVLLILGGTALVAGASQLAVRLGVSPMIVGLTIVGFGTSAPELVVNVVGGLRGESALAFGNVIGSNISNLALVLGAAALLQKIEIQGKVIRREVPLLLLVTTVITVMSLDNILEGSPARIGTSDAVILLLLFAIFVYIIMQDILMGRNKDTLLTEIDNNPLVATDTESRFSPAYIAIGFVLLFVGGQLTVSQSVVFATQLGISTTIIGLFIVAIGTSLPELITSIMAAWRKESDLALGNILGSNVFNSLIVLPAGALTGALAIPSGGVQDLLVSWLLSAALIPIFLFG